MPQEAGVYLFRDGKKKILYVGKAKNLKNRVSSYFIKRGDLGEKTRILISKTEYIEYFTVSSEVESLLLEADYIKKYTPPYNVRFTDGKTYPRIRISIHEKYPAVLIARKIDEENSIYYGPFPNGGAMKLVLKTIRPILPFQSVEHHPKTFCLYHHLGLCPCASAIGSVQVQKEYKKTIRRIMLFLEGNIQKVVSELEKERNMAAKAEEFELAKSIQEKINAIRLITHPVHSPFEYEDNPNLLSDIRRKELNQLAFHLREHGVAVSEIKRIECYDISNTSGTNATASLVVFTGGEKDSRWYRRFKIHPENKGPNDFAMMQEVIQRRFRHDEWPMPDLVIVDGGKGQISSAQEALETMGKKVALVGLAKREEIVITSEFREIKLAKNSPALQLLIRIRNEAHRFALMYHRKLRSKFTFS